jgi:hypothetical protein
MAKEHKVTVDIKAWYKILNIFNLFVIAFIYVSPQHKGVSLSRHFKVKLYRPEDPGGGKRSRLHYSKLKESAA